MVSFLCISSSQEVADCSAASQRTRNTRSGASPGYFLTCALFFGFAMSAPGQAPLPLTSASSKNSFASKVTGAVNRGEDERHLQRSAVRRQHALPP
jgi:hypothetical protein